MEEVHKKIKLTQWGSQILTLILTSQMMITKNPQNVHRKYFWAILMTFISDAKIDINMCEPHYVYLFFLWTSSIVQMFDYLTFDIFLRTWHLFDIFLIFWVQIAYGSHCPFAHTPVPHCPCDPLLMWPIALVPHTPCALLPMCPIPPVPPLPIVPVAYTPCTPYPLYTMAPSFWHFDT